MAFFHLDYLSVFSARIAELKIRTELLKGLVSYCNHYFISGKHRIALSLTSFAKKEMLLYIKAPKSKKELIRSYGPNHCMEANGMSSSGKIIPSLAIVCKSLSDTGN